MALARYMLDTNTVSYILKGQSARARRKMLTLSEEEDVCVSSITEAEIRYGLAKRPMKLELRARIERFLDAIDVLPWGSDAARAYGTSRAKLEASGKPVNNMDLLIGSHAMAAGAVLVTNDRVFRYLADSLRIVNWATDLPVRG
jgi:tRNA(fMet)-specific endonuclease VapC